MELNLDYEADVFVDTANMDEETWLECRRKGIGCQGRMINDRKRREIIDPIAGSSNAGFLTAGYSSAGILAGGVV